MYQNTIKTDVLSCIFTVINITVVKNGVHFSAHPVETFTVTV